MRASRDSCSDRSARLWDRWKTRGRCERRVQNIRQALSTASNIPSFWLLNAGFFVCGFHLAFVGVHLPAFLADEGFAPWLATAALTAVGVTNIIGVYAFGTLGGLYSKKMLLSGLYLARAVVFLLFFVTPINEG